MLRREWAASPSSSVELTNRTTEKPSRDLQAAEHRETVLRESFAEKVAYETPLWRDPTLKGASNKRNKGPSFANKGCCAGQWDAAVEARSRPR